MNPGESLERLRRGGWPPEIQGPLEALVATIENAENTWELPDELEWLHIVNPCDIVSFVEYACDTYGLHAQIVEAYKAGDWERYVVSHPDYLRIFALIKAVVDEGLEGELYWRLLTTVYVQDDFVSSNQHTYAGLYQSDMNPDMTPDRRAAMNAEEVRVYDELPLMVTAYRGARSDNCRGLSWTLELSVAEFFARRTGGVVYTVTVPKDAVFVYYAERKEAEVLIDPDRLPEPQPLTTTPQSA